MIDWLLLKRLTIASSCRLTVRVGGVLWCCVTLPCALELELSLDGTPDQEALPAAITKAGEQAYSLNQMGLQALDQDLLDTALAYFERAAEALPAYSDAINNRGVVYFRRGMVSRAREIWVQLAAADPDYAIAQYNLGISSYHEKDYAAAGERFRAALQSSRRFHQALVMLGRIELEQGKKRAARKYLEQAYEIAPDVVDVWSMTAYGMVETGDTSKAERILLRHTDTFIALEMLGKIESGRGRLERAAQYFTDAVAAGGSSDILVNLASVHLDAGRCSDALKAVEAYIGRVSPPSADALVVGGVAAKECGDMATALLRFQQGVKYYPHDPILRFNLGQVLFYTADYAGAEAVWAPLGDTLSDPTLFYLRALAAHRRGMGDAAETFIRKAISLDKRAEYYDVLGVVLYARGDTAAAGANFRSALKIDPGLKSAQLNLALATKDGDASVAGLRILSAHLDTCRSDCGAPALQLAILHYRLGDIANALKVLGAVPESERTASIARHEAIFSRMAGELSRALGILERAKELYVLDPETEHELAQCYMEAGFYGKAVVVFESLLDRWNRNPWRIYYQMGYAFMEQDQLAKALEFFDKSLRVKADNPAARALSAFVLNRMGETDRARELWEKNLKDDPTNPTLWTNMGLALEKEGKYEEALEKYLRAAQIRQGDAALGINIGNVYLALGRYEKAVEAYRGALRSSKRETAAYNAFIAAQRMKAKATAEEMAGILRSEYADGLNTRRVLGEMALWQGDTAQALKLFDGLDTKNVNDWYALAGIYVAQGRGGDARAAIEHLPKDSVWSRARSELTAQQAFHEGDYDRARKLWRSLADTSFSVRYNQALAALQAKDFEEAMRLGRELIGRADGRDRADVCRLIGNAAFGLKQWDTARRWYEQLSGFDTRNPLVQYNLAVASYNLGEMDKAWGHYIHARELDPSISNSDIEKRHAAVNSAESGTSTVLEGLDSLYNTAVELQGEGNDSAAMEIYRRILADDQEYYQAWNNLGAIHAARGELDMAKECYARAISRRHDLVEAYANLAGIHIALGEFDKARRWLFKGEHHNPGDALIGEMLAKLREAAAAAEVEEADSAAGP